MSKRIESLEFEAEVVQVSSKKLKSLDIEYRAVIAGTDPIIHTLGLLDADSRVRITLEVIHG